MAMNLLPVLLLGGAALLLMRSGEEADNDGLTDPQDGDGSGFTASSVGEVKPWEVGVSPNMETVEVGSTWTIKVLDKWLGERREAGLLMTKQDAEGWWYTTFVANPQSALGYIFTLGDEGADQQSAGEFAFAALWTAVAVGTGLRGLSRRMTKSFLAKNTRIDATRFAAKEAKALPGVQVYTATDPTFWDKAGSVGALVTAGAELSENNEGMAASAVEAFTDFMGSDDGRVLWFGPTAEDVELTRIDDLAETDDVLAFKRSIMAYILNFQKRTFSEG